MPIQYVQTKKKMNPPHPSNDNDDADATAANIPLFEDGNDDGDDEEEGEENRIDSDEEEEDNNKDEIDEAVFLRLDRADRAEVTNDVSVTSVEVVIHNTTSKKVLVILSYAKYDVTLVARGKLAAGFHGSTAGVDFEHIRKMEESRACKFSIGPNVKSSKQFLDHGTKSIYVTLLVADPKNEDQGVVTLDNYKWVTKFRRRGTMKEKVLKFFGKTRKVSGGNIFVIENEDVEGLATVADVNIRSIN